MKNANPTILAFVVALAVFTIGASPGAKQRSSGSLPKPTSPMVSGDYTVFDVNNIRTFVRNNGSFDRDPGTGNAGYEWPKGTGNTAIYASGLWIGSRSSDGVVRVAVAEYDYEYAAGPMIGQQWADPDDPGYRMYKIKRGDNALNSPDYAAWPVQDGAPVDENGKPLLIGDMTVWCVFNEADPSVHTNMNAPPLGVEIQMTAFGFNRSDALGNAIFYKWKIINKGGRSLDSTYITIWSDVDLGDSGDDYDGCDTTLGLGITYNGDPVDGVYGSTPPATGFDFLQGPLVPGAPTDTARFPDGRTFPGMKLLKMTSFIKYSNDATDLGNPQTGEEVFNYQKGVTRSGQLIRDPQNNPTTFMFPGDPTQPSSATNWIETDPPGDRRFMMTAGPFHLADGDTQEIVAANLIAVGADYKGSVTAVKNADALVQTAYDLNFKLAAPPEPPIVEATPLDAAMILSWGDGNEAAAKAIDIEATETLDPIAQAGGAVDATYNFQGYVVYQLPSASADPSTWKVFKTFDLPGNVEPIYDNVFDPVLGYQVNKPVKYGENQGIQRTILIDRDLFANTPLRNSKDYYYVVSSYTYNDESVPKTLESGFNVITVRPGKLLGLRTRSSRGDTIAAVSRVAGASDGFAQAFVVNPSRVTGDDYLVTFSRDTVSGNILWNVDNQTTGQRLLSNQVNQTGDEAYPTVDGIMIKVFGAPNDMKGIVEVANAGGPHDPTQGAFLFNGSEFPSLIECDPGGPTPPGCDRPTPNVSGASWGIHTGADGLGTPPDIHYPYFVSRVFRGTNFSRFVPYDFELRFVGNGTGAKGYMRFSTENVVDIPFELWNIGINTPEDPSDDYRMIAGIFDFETLPAEPGYDVFNMVQNDHPISGGDNDPETDWIYWYDPVDRSPGQAGYTAWAANPDPEALLGGEVMARMVLVNFNAGSISDPTWPLNIPAERRMVETGSVFRIVATKPNQPNSDQFLVSTAGLQPTENSELAKTDISLVNVVPNPYFGANAYERNQFNRVVRFTNLPANATVRIFNLVGDLVRTLRKTENDPGTTVDWDLQNENALPVASGMYIAYVDMPGLGTRTLKLAVILSQERLDNF